MMERRPTGPSRKKLLTLLALAVLASGCSRPHEFQMAISDVSIVDVVSGVVIPNQSIGLRDGQIAYIGAAPVAAETVVSGRNRWAIPGLWDMHVHISDPSFFPLFLANGIVGVRDMGGASELPSSGCESIELGTLQAWRAEIQAGTRLGPEIVAAGPVLSGTGSPSAIDVRTVDKARDAVATVAAAGADFIKVY